MAKNGASSAAIEPTEVLTKAEYEARERQKATAVALQKRRRQLAQSSGVTPPAALGAIAGDLIARVIGGNPRIGRALGAAAASVLARKERKRG